MKAQVFPSAVGFAQLRTFSSPLWLSVAALCMAVTAGFVHAQNTNPLPHLEFSQYFHAGGGTVITQRYTLAGPAGGGRLYAGSHLARAGDSELFYGAERQDVYRVNGASGSFGSVPLGGISAELGQQGWPTGTGYDATRREVVLVSLGGEGYIHTYSTSAGWRLVTSMGNWDFDNIEHHAQDDLYYGVQNSHVSSPGDVAPIRLSSISRIGTHGNTITVDYAPFGVGFNDHQAELVSLGDYLVLLLEPGTDYYKHDFPSESRIYLINLQTGESRLTYRKVWESFPPENRPPGVTIIAPEHPSSFDAGTTIQLRASASDLDGQIVKVEFFANGALLGQGEAGDDGSGNTVYELDWTPQPGTYSLMARATDNLNAVGNSSGVSVAVHHAPSNRVKFTFYPETGIFVPGGQIFDRAYSLTGPDTEGRLLPGMTMVSDGHGFSYGIYWDEVYRVDESTGIPQKLELPAGLEPMSWPLGITFDSNRNRVLVVTIGGEGFLYSYSIATGEWNIVASMENNDFDSLLYLPDSDQILATSTPGISTLNAQGQVINYFPVRPISDSFGSAAYSSFGLGPAGYHSEMALVDGDKVAILVEPVIYNGLGGAMESRIVSVDLATETSQLTYRKIWNQPPTNIPPVAAIVVPEHPLTVQPGASLRLTALASDSDGYIQKVELHANGQLLGDARLRAEPGGAVFYDFDWSPAPGTYSVIARAIDDVNGAGDSVALSVQVLAPEVEEEFELTFYPVHGLSVNPAQLFSQDYTEEGPVAPSTRLLPGMRMVTDGHGDYYGTHWHRVYKVDANTGTPVELTIPSELESDFSWPMGVAFDTERNRLLVVTLGGEGSLYAYSVATGQWSVVASMDNYDYDSILYYPELDQIFAYQNGSIHKLSATGQIVGNINVPRVDLHVGPGGYHSEMVLVEGNRIALLLEPVAYNTIQEGSESRIYMIDLASAAVEMTYRKVWPQVPPNTPPTVQIVAPADGSNYVLGESVALRAVAADTNGAVVAVEFFANGEKIGNGTRVGVPDTSSVSHWSFHWTPSAGTYFVVARAHDEQGNFTESILVNITVGFPEPAVPTVGVVPNDPEATEFSHAADGFDSARFMVTRSGDRSRSLTVFYSIHGTARNGEDYHLIQNAVVILAGEGAATISIVPISDFDAEKMETVGIRLEPPPMLLTTEPTIAPVGSYHIDAERRNTAAVIYERLRPEFAAMEVVIPGPGYRYYEEPVEFVIAGYANAMDVPAVDHYVDGQKVGTSSNEVDHVPVPVGGYFQHHFVLPNPTAGEHVLQARAVGNRLVSSQVPFFVGRFTDSAAFVQRELPETYSPGVPISVSLHANPPDGTRAYAVEDSVPTGWTVREVSHEGSVDPVSGKVKFGPFTHAQARTLTYRVTPPTNAIGRAEFGGNSSRDGVLYPIGGDRVIEGVSPFHPADGNQNSAIDLVELTAYAAAWKAGESWPSGPSPIPLSYVTRAAQIWKRGETYSLLPRAGAPFCWMPLAAVYSPIPVITAASVAVSERIAEGMILPGGSTLVRIEVAPPDGASAYAIEEKVPARWSVSNVSEGGVYDSEANVIRWGLFLDAKHRTLTYSVSAPGGVTSVADLSGAASVDGQTIAITGADRIVAASEGTAVTLAVETTSFGGVHVRISARPGQIGVLEYSTDLVIWNDFEPVSSPDGTANLKDQTVGADRARFYRFRAR